MAQTPSHLPHYTQSPRPPRSGKPPFWMISGGLCLVVASWLPLALFARARASVSNLPRVQLVQDMGIQPKYREQQSSEVFADGRADRPRIIGTVARGRLDDDDHYSRGYTWVTNPKTGKPEASFFSDFPQQVKMDEALLRRGQERFNIYCSVCHGLDGQGHGAINERALELQKLGPELSGGTMWSQAADLTVDPVKSRPTGHIFNTISVGIRNMPGYGSQVPTEDRWAIVAYVRALQLARDAPASILPPELKEKLMHAR